MHARQGSDSITDTRKIIVQISNSNPAKLNAALDETEGLLDTYRRANQLVQVEVIANKHAVDMLRTNVSAYAARINMLQQKYPNLNFMVCGQTIGKLREKAKACNYYRIPELQLQPLNKLTNAFSKDGVTLEYNDFLIFIPAKDNKLT